MNRKSKLSRRNQRMIDALEAAIGDPRSGLHVSDFDPDEGTVEVAFLTDDWPSGPQEVSIRLQITGGRTAYECYLGSPEWKALRLIALGRAGHRCQVCNRASRSLEVHHRTYERIGREDPSDLTVLCRRCHERFHTQPTPED